jgi:hypothetical protein
MSGEEEAAELLHRCVGGAADLVAVGHINDTRAVMVANAVRAAFACALGNGLIKVVPEEEWPMFIVSTPPYGRETP